MQPFHFAGSIYPENCFVVVMHPASRCGLELGLRPWGWGSSPAH